MQVLFSGDTGCSEETLKRLLVLCDEIAFMDRPSVMAGNFGTVGHASMFRRLDARDWPVKIVVHDAPSGPVHDLYLRYFEADLANERFRKLVWQGLIDGGLFASKLIQPKANYGWGTGEQVRQALLADQSVLASPLTEELGPDMYKMDTQQGRNVTLKVCLFEASVQVSNAILVAEAAGLRPVSDDPVICQLLALRMAAEEYIHTPTTFAAVLGLAVGRAAIPDEMLARVHVRDLLEFRNGTKDLYGAWSDEIARLSVKLEEIPADKLDAATAKIILTEVEPKLKAINNEMAGARDKLFGDLASKLTQWQVPTLSLAYVAGLSPAGALAAFASALAPAVPPVVDYFVKRRDIQRKNAMAYLLQLSKDLKG